MRRNASQRANQMSIENEPTTSNKEEEVQPLQSTNDESMDRRILKLVHQCAASSNQYVIRPAYLASHLGLSLDDATSELCGLMSAVGGGERGASFVFEKVETPDASTMTMVFTFPSDFEARALSYRRKMNWYQRLKNFSTVIVKAVKIFTAFGLIISLAVIMVAGVCLLVAAVIAMARGGGRNNNNHQILMRKLRFLLLQLRQILWLYAICGSDQGDPFMREVAGDLALMLSCCVGNPMHMWFWMRMGGRRRNGGGLFRYSQRRGWGMRNWRGDNRIDDEDGVAMIRRGSWSANQHEEMPSPNSSSSIDNTSSSLQQKGLLSVAVEFLFGPSNNENETIAAANIVQAETSQDELNKWKFRAAIIMSISTASEGKGVSLRELLPYTDNPPSSINDASALRETMKIVTYFNGKPAKNLSSDSIGGIDAQFYFPEIMAEIETEFFGISQNIMSLSSSTFAPPSNPTQPSITKLLYKSDEEEHIFDASGGMPQYLFEKPTFFTYLSKKQFSQCLFLGMLNFIGVLSVRSALMPGGLFDLSIAAALALDADDAASGSSRRRRRYNGDMWISVGSAVALKILNMLQFYAILFFLLPTVRLMILMLQNFCIDRRNRRRMSFVTE